MSLDLFSKETLQFLFRKRLLNLCVLGGGLWLDCILNEAERLSFMSIMYEGMYTFFFFLACRRYHLLRVHCNSAILSLPKLARGYQTCINHG